MIIVIVLRFRAPDGMALRTHALNHRILNSSRLNPALQENKRSRRVRSQVGGDGGGHKKHCVSNSDDLISNLC